ncbi:mechanosensitive ion channel family protein [Chondrinema litorale]|uniref:mechanosensitive ion channel family protein n=1 Tax=Chondrinema litorale TaxID=2994555 RepID=UPI0025434695|nr:mechanosensitive ion channel family protein [Chondrinema litorale]UZR92356.1 mechanosensitive ion channel family protein [Chondrinema litorale]
MYKTQTSILFFFIFLYSNCFAQTNEKDTPSANLSTPYNTVVTHLQYLQEDSYYPKIAAQSLNAENLSEDQKVKLAVKLKQIYDGTGNYIDPEIIPQDPNYTDSLRNNQNKYVVVSSLPSIYLEKVGNKWLYSANTVKQIDAIHKDVYPFGTSELLDLVHFISDGGKVAGKKYIGLYVWQHIGLLLLIFICFVAHKIFTFFIEKVLVRLLERFRKDTIAGNYIVPVAKPISLLVICWFAAITFPVLQFPIFISQYIIKILNALLPFFVVMVIYKMINVLCYYLEKITSKTETTLDDQLIPLLRKSLKIFVIIGGVIFILQNLEFDITGLLAGISIGGLAFALAAQDTLKNLFGSLMIFVDRPFTVGDWIVTDGVDGTVEEVGFRSTRVRTFHNSVVSIPNGNIADMTIDNMGMRIYRRFKTNIAITYDTPPELIEAFIEGLKQIVKNHPDTRKDYYEIHMNNFGASSLDILFYIFFSVPDWSGELKARGEIMIDIIHLANKLEVRFAFPTSTLHVETFPEKKSLTPDYDISKNAFMAKLKYLQEGKQAKN